VKRASEAPFPYGWPGHVLYMEQHRAELVSQLQTRDQLRGAVLRALAGDSHLLAAWPGQYRTDLFVIDKPELLAEAIGLVSA
jgi:hypothetical protein